MADNTTRALLAEREKTHGAFDSHSKIAQDIKTHLRNSPNWRQCHLSRPQREALEMIASKIARICVGDPHDPDHWRDIAGYATLIAEPLRRTS